LIGLATILLHAEKKEILTDALIQKMPSVVLWFLELTMHVHGMLSYDRQSFHQQIRAVQAHIETTNYSLRALMFK
jgi:hypothetical protein